jgi:hypothetical protein
MSYALVVFRGFASDLTKYMYSSVLFIFPHALEATGPPEPLDRPADALGQTLHRAAGLLLQASELRAIGVTPDTCG